MAGDERRGAAGGAPQRPAGEGEGERAANRIRVSNSARPLFFYVNLARRYLAEHDEVVVSALGVATATAVTVVEVLKNKGLARTLRVGTSSVLMARDVEGGADGEEERYRKAKIEFVIARTERFHQIEEAEREARRDGNRDESMKDAEEGEEDGEGDAMIRL